MAFLCYHEKAKSLSWFGMSYMVWPLPPSPSSPCINLIFLLTLNTVFYQSLHLLATDSLAIVFPLDGIFITGPFITFHTPFSRGSPRSISFYCCMASRYIDFYLILYHFKWHVHLINPHLVCKSIRAQIMSLLTSVVLDLIK